jgi:hypothetical protein
MAKAMPRTRPSAVIAMGQYLVEQHTSIENAVRAAMKD